MKKKQNELAPHPRLYIGSGHIDRLREPLELDFLQACMRRVEREARQCVGHPDFQTLSTGHNAHLIRARQMQCRVFNLLVLFLRSGADRYRQSVLNHVQTMASWEYWSWIAWRRGDADPMAIFDLSYGENSATLAVAYDLLHGTLDDEQRAMFHRCALQRSFRPFLKHTRPGHASWWFGKPDSNWNSVCAGGAGMLALAMHDELAEARKVLERCETSIAPFIQALDGHGGGWPEGIGYWNYGMRYAFMYLLSHERATQRKHPLLRRAGLRKTLAFPADFCPHGQACSFGDANGFRPLAVHYAMAERLRAHEVIERLDRLMQYGDPGRQADWPNPAELLLLHPRQQRLARTRTDADHIRLYKGLDWGVMADRMPDPSLYVSVRGGTTEVPHGHMDLTSFHCLAGDQRMIENIGAGAYLDTTFSPRRYELVEMNSQSKNVLLLNGVGIAKPAHVRTRMVRHEDMAGFHFDATEALAVQRGERDAVRAYHRAIIHLDWQAILVLDALRLAQPGLVETRLHTRAAVTRQQSGFLLRQSGQAMRVACAASVKFRTHQATLAHTHPNLAASMMRSVAENLHRDVVMASLLVPGAGAARISLAVDQASITVTTRIRGAQRMLRLTPRLLFSQ